MLIPAISKGKGYAKRIACAGNLKQCGSLSILYADDSNGFLPPVAWGNGPNAAWGYSWDDALGLYTKQNPGASMESLRLYWAPAPKSNIFLCPEDTKAKFLGGAKRSYSMVKGLGAGIGGAPGGSPSNVYGVGDEPDGSTLAWPWTAKLSALLDPSGTLLLAEWHCDNQVLGGSSCAGINSPSNQDWGGTMHFQYPAPHGARTYSYLFCDGHAGVMEYGRTMGPSGSVNVPRGMWTRTPGD